MNQIYFLAIKAPLHFNQNMAAIASAALVAAGLGAGVYLSRKQFKKLRRKLVWTAIQEKWHQFWHHEHEGHHHGGGCFWWLLALPLLIVLAFVLWPLAILVLVILIIVWIVRAVSGRSHDREM